MATVKVTVHGINQNAICSLSGKECEVLNVTIEPDTAPVNLSQKSFLSLLKMKCGQDSKGVANASPAPVTQRPQPIPAAVPIASANQVK